jgi:hypothetical protein
MLEDTLKLKAKTKNMVANDEEDMAEVVKI